MLPSKQQFSFDEDDGNLVTDSVQYRGDNARSRSHRNVSPSDDGLISRDGASARHISAKWTSVDRIQSVGCRVDSGFDSLTLLAPERFSSKHLTPTELVDPMSSSSKLKEETTTNSVFDSGYGLSEQDICVEQEDGIEDRLQNMSIHESTTSTDSSQTSFLTQYPNSSFETTVEDNFSQDEDGDTALHLAIIHEMHKYVCSLIDHVPHVTYLNLKNNLHQTPLHLAVLTNQPKLVRKLVTAGANLEMRDRRGNTALHLACQEGFLGCVNELLRPITHYESNPRAIQELDCSEKYGPSQDLELCNYEGQMCVHIATLQSRFEIVHILYQYGADMNSQEGKSGRTALHYAVEARNGDLVGLLILECKANLNPQTFSGLTPIQLCYTNNNEMISLLLTLGAADLGPPLSDSECDSDSSVDETTMDATNDTECDFFFNGEPLSV